MRTPADPKIFNEQLKCGGTSPEKNPNLSEAETAARVDGPPRRRKTPPAQAASTLLFRYNESTTLFSLYACM